MKTYDLNRKQRTTADKGKKENPIALRTFSKNDVIEEEEEMAYITKKFQKIIKKHGAFQKKSSTKRTAIANDLCHKCGSLAIS